MSSRIVIWFKYLTEIQKKKSPVGQTGLRPSRWIQKECHVANSWTCPISCDAFRLPPPMDLHIAVCLSMGLRLREQRILAKIKHCFLTKCLP